MVEYTINRVFNYGSSFSNKRSFCYSALLTQRSNDINADKKKKIKVIHHHKRKKRKKSGHKPNTIYSQDIILNISILLTLCAMIFFMIETRPDLFFKSKNKQDIDSSIKNIAINMKIFTEFKLFHFQPIFLGSPKQMTVPENAESISKIYGFSMAENETYIHCICLNIDVSQVKSGVPKSKVQTYIPGALIETKTMNRLHIQFELFPLFGSSGVHHLRTYKINNKACKSKLTENIICEDKCATFQCNTNSNEFIGEEDIYVNIFN